MYSLSKLLRGLRDPRRAFIELNRLYHEHVAGIERIGVMDRDWDTLIILDGCRYDLFKEVNDISGSLEAVISRGSSTAEFLHENFGNRTYFNTVYVSANPQLERHDMKGRFYACECLWEEEWDTELGTVRPEVVTEQAIDTFERYPKKRLIAHYVQPHFPFIGELGREITHSGFAETPGNLDETGAPTVWERMEHGNLSRERVWKAYRENLELALPEVRRLLDAVPGKSVVTSDHGNAFGEMGVYGHPGNHYLHALVRVPWLGVADGERRRIVDSDTSVEQDNDRGDDSTVKERLVDLGYRT